MAELTQAELETKIAAIDVQIATLYGTPSSMASYTVGQKSVSASQSVDGLLKVREIYQNLLDSFPAEGFQRFAIDFSDKGEDTTEYLGDSGE